MAGSSFEIDDSFSSRSRRPHRSHRTRASSRSSSRFFSPTGSHHMSRNTNPRRARNPSPASPFASDNDLSWQSELSWHFEPTGFRDSNLSAALTPWIATTPSESRIFRRTANDYYLSRTARNSSNQNYDLSGYGAVPTRRLELQSYVARDDDSSFFGRNYISGEYSISRGFSHLEAIKEERGRTGSDPFANKHELNLIDYVPSEDENHLGLALVGQHHGHRPSPIGQDHSGHSSYQNHRHGLSGGGYDLSHDFSHGGDYSYGQRSHGQSKEGHHHGYHDADDISAEDEEDDGDEEEDEWGSARQVGLFSLFRYSTKWDMVLMFLGCVGALINGGALPWYSYLFGKFVSKIATDSSDDKSQVMKQVNKR